MSRYIWAATAVRDFLFGWRSTAFVKRITVALAFIFCLAFAVLAWLAYLLFACPVIGARHGWSFADGIIRKEIGK